MLTQLGKVTVELLYRKEPQPVDGFGPRHRGQHLLTALVDIGIRRKLVREQFLGVIQHLLEVVRLNRRDTRNAKPLPFEQCLLGNDQETKRFTQLLILNRIHDEVGAILDGP